MLASSSDKKIYFFDALKDYEPMGFIDCNMYYDEFFSGYGPLLFDFSSSGKQIRVMAGINEDAMPVQVRALDIPSTAINPSIISGHAKFLPFSILVL